MRSQKNAKHITPYVRCLLKRSFQKFGKTKTSYYKLTEDGRIDPEAEQLRRILSYIGVMSGEFEAAQIFPEGHPFAKIPKKRK